MTVGRLYVRSYRTQGPGFRVRLFGPPDTYRGAELWLGRRMFMAWWLHRKSCDCGVCRYDRALMEKYQ